MLKNIKWLIPFALFFLGYFVPHVFLKTTSLEVPNLLGKPVHEALTLLTNTQINSRVVYYKEDQTLPAGTVLTQIPAPGQTIKPHQTVLLTLSQQQKLNGTPSYLQKKLTNQDLALFKKQAIRLKKIPLNSTAPDGNCIAQIPSPDVISKDKSLILYTAHNDNSLVVFPNFENYTVDKVIEFLKENNITYKIIHKNTQLTGNALHNEAPHDCIENQCIITEQRPLAGSFINLNDQLTVTLKID